MELQKWALVTGASRGIGRQMALALADAGVNLVVHSSQISGTSALLEELRPKGVAAEAVAADLSDPVAVQKMADDVASRFQIDLLFNNAGINTAKSTAPGVVDPAKWVNDYLVNVVAPTILIQTLEPGMKQRGYGRIINTTSGILDQPCSYAASKGALNKLTRDYASTLTGTGVTMNVLDPGWIRTDLGGDEAPNDVATTIPGAIVGGFLPDDVNGMWINAQDFTGLTLEEAIAVAPSKVLKLSVTDSI